MHDLWYKYEICHNTETGKLQSEKKSVFVVFLTDNPNRDVPSEKETRSERRKWLTDLCVEYLEKYIFNTDEVTVLVEQIQELHQAQQQPFQCRQPGCGQTYRHHIRRVQ